jgi:transposase
MAALQRLYRTTSSADLRTRCHMILLSTQRYTVAQIAALLFFGEDTVLYWLNRYEADGLAGLADRPRSGRPPKSIAQGRSRAR